MPNTTSRPLPKEVRLFGRNLKEAREIAGLSQVAVSEKTGVSQPDVSAIEAGRQNVTLERMVRLAKAVRSTVRDLLEP